MVSLHFSNGSSSFGPNPSNGKRENLTPTAGSSAISSCSELDTSWESWGQWQALTAALQQELLPLRVLWEPLRRKERAHPQLLHFIQKQIKPRNSCALSLLCNPSFLAVSGHTGCFGGVICALNFGLQATAEEQHLVAKINKRQAPESFLPALARRQEGMAPGQHRAHPAVLPLAPEGRERGKGAPPSHRRGPCL